MVLQACNEQETFQDYFGLLPSWSLHSVLHLMWKLPEPKQWLNLQMYTSKWTPLCCTTATSSYHGEDECNEINAFKCSNFMPPVLAVDHERKCRGSIIFSCWEIYYCDHSFSSRIDWNIGYLILDELILCQSALKFSFFLWMVPRQTGNFYKINDCIPAAIIPKPCVNDRNLERIA